MFSSFSYTTNSLYRQFPARSPLNSSSEFLKIEYYNLRIDPGIERTASQQAGYQVAALVVTLVIAIVGGLGTGNDGCDVTGVMVFTICLLLWPVSRCNIALTLRCQYLLSDDADVLGMVLLLPFFRQPSEENDSQSDVTLAVDQLLLTDRNATVDDVRETEPVAMEENPTSIC